MVLAARLLLAAVFALAAAAKLRDPAEAREAFLRLGAAKAAARLAAIALAVFELALAAALLVPATAAWAAALAALVLLGFSGELAAARARGDDDCACFGALFLSRPGWAAIARNAALAAIAVYAAVAG